MFCIHCGYKNETGHSFCTNCGQSTTHKDKGSAEKMKSPLDEKWWYRFLKVAYIILYFPLLIIIPVVWEINRSVYTGNYNGLSSYENNYTGAFWYSLVTLAIYFIIARLIKITFLYIIFGQKPEWSKEFRKFF